MPPVRLIAASRWADTVVPTASLEVRGSGRAAIVSDSPAALLDSLADRGVRADFGWSRVGVPDAAVDRIEDLPGDMHGSGSGAAVHRRLDARLDADHKVVKFIQNRVSGFQIERFAA
jgi:hypothetical protein